MRELLLNNPIGRNGVAAKGAAHRCLSFLGSETVPWSRLCRGGGVLCGRARKILTHTRPSIKVFLTVREQTAIGTK